MLRTQITKQTTTKTTTQQQKSQLDIQAKRMEDIYVSVRDVRSTVLHCIRLHSFFNASWSKCFLLFFLSIGVVSLLFFTAQSAHKLNALSEKIIKA